MLDLIFLNMNDKVYEQEVIVENPFPNEVVLPVSTQIKTSEGVYTQATEKEKVFPKKKFATELIGQALNTRSKKILQEFQLEQSGGMKIGDYQSGVSGDIRITPGGVTARDKAGLTTFALDGDTGDAIFKGQISSGSIMTEGAIIDELGNTIIDSEGLVSNNNFESNSTNSSGSQEITSASPVDLTGSSMTTSYFKRSKKVLILLSCTMRALEVSPGAFDADGFAYINVDSSNYQNVRHKGWSASGEFEGATLPITGANFRLTTLGVGIHTIKSQALVSSVANGKIDISNWSLFYFVLGN